MARVLGVLAFVACGAVLAHEQDRVWGQPEELCHLDSEEVNESSGIAPSTVAGGVYFTHNDSGDSARFFRFTRAGKVEGTYTLKGVEAEDWEDMASATVDGKGYLYFGDVGDNDEDRERVVVHRVTEPTSLGEQTLTEFESYTVKYPDSPHNCEALFVTRNGDIWVVTKDPGGNSKVFVLPRPKGTGDYTFHHVANIAVDTAGLNGKYVTAGDVSPDNKYVVLRTYSAALEYKVPEKFEDWPKTEPLTVRTAPEIQGEAVCYSRDGRYLVTTSEFAPCPVSVVPLKGP
jgi:hypothetical protein